MKNRWDIFIQQIQADLKVFLLVWLCLTVFRLVFIFFMDNYLEAGTTAYDILLSLYYGARLSLKTAAVIMLFTFIFVTMPTLISKKKCFIQVRLFLAGVYFFGLSFLFMAKFPYYQEFHTGFNQMIFNALADDQSAIFEVMVTQYDFWQRLSGAILITVIFLFILFKILQMKNLKCPTFATKMGNRSFRILICCILVAFAIFVRFGASFTYAKSLHWENCSLSKDAFLNEVILDDVQAVYRAYSIKKRIENGIAAGVDKHKIQQYLLKKNNTIGSGKKVDDYLEQQALGNTINKPKHIFLIIGESYAQWPLLPQYEKLHIADGVKAIMQRDNADTVKNFLPNGAFTPMAVNAIISGLSDVSIYPNHQPESYKQIYQTALAPQLKKLGYKAVFWYAGFSGWERIRDFALAQGFDEFHSASDFPYQSGNVWGCDDEYLFKAIRSKASQEDAPTVHVILTVSNHAPYSVDLSKAGFDEKNLIEQLPEEEKNNVDLIKRLGHFWYMDKLIGEFTAAMYEQYPQDSLFIITGDHADRTNIEKVPSLFDRYTVPFIIYGNGVTKNTLPDQIAGGHVNIGATLIEMIAPKDFVYYTVGESLTRKSRTGFNHNLWITPTAIGEIDSKRAECLSEGAIDPEEEREAAMDTLSMMRTISWWRTMRGNETQK